MIAYWFNRLADVLDEELASRLEAYKVTDARVQGLDRFHLDRFNAAREFDDYKTLKLVFGALAVVLRKVGGEQR